MDLVRFKEKIINTFPQFIDMNFIDNNNEDNFDINSYPSPKIIRHEFDISNFITIEDKDKKLEKLKYDYYKHFIMTLLNAVSRYFSEGKSITFDLEGIIHQNKRDIKLKSIRKNLGNNLSIPKPKSDDKEKLLHQLLKEKIWDPNNEQRPETIIASFGLYKFFGHLTNYNYYQNYSNLQSFQLLGKYLDSDIYLDTNSRVDETYLVLLSENISIDLSLPTLLTRDKKVTSRILDTVNNKVNQMGCLTSEFYLDITNSPEMELIKIENLK